MIDEYVEKGYWDETTLYDLWDRNARNLPDREAIADSEHRLTWIEAKQWIDRLALGFLDLGLKRDDLIVVQVPNGVEHTLLRVACEKAGLLCLPALRNLRHTEMEYILGHTEAVGVAIPREFRDFNYYQMIQELRPRLPRLRHVFVVGDKVPEGGLSIMDMVKRPIEESYPPDTLLKTGLKSTEASLIIHTTGTTGLPKFVEYAACHRIWQWKRNAEVLNVTGDDVFALITPHCGGIALPAFYGAPLLGARLTILQSPDIEDAFRLIEGERVNFACVVPTQLAMMSDHPRWDQYDLSSLRLWWCTGAPLPYEVGIKAEAKLGGTIMTLLGATDWGCEIINVPESSQEVRFRTVGKPIDGTELRLINEDGREVPPGEVGEIQGRGPTGVSGYFRDLEATMEVWTEDGWYKTGDLGRLDEGGNLVVVGRKKDMIIRGGMNIYPIEIENILLKHPKVLDVAIVGMPDPLMGQRACAFVVPRSGQEFSFDDMVSFLKEKRVSSFKLPERLELVQEIPTVGGGGQKADKKQMTAMITEKLRTEGKIK
jgi:non-ribosomal peptide synthetase component E (peptide arylation enzyme)